MRIIFVVALTLVSSWAIGAEMKRDCLEDLTETRAEARTETLTDVQTRTHIENSPEAQIDTQIKALPSEERARLEAKAESLAAQLENENNSVPGLLFWTVSIYLSARGYGPVKEMYLNGRLPEIASHYSNFAVGLPAIGLADHLGCLALEFCAKQARRILGQAETEIVKKSLAALKSRTPSYRTLTVLVASSMFTLFNAGFELNGLVPGLNFLGSSNHMDWADFISGESAILVYMVYLKTLDRKLRKIKYPNALPETNSDS